MGKEQGALLNILERMSPHDKEVILLAPIFFWAKYMRRKINTEGFQPVVLDVDFNDPVSILRAGFDLHRQANSDINGDSVNAVSNTLTNHLLRAELFPCLEDWEIRAVCYGLDKILVLKSKTLLKQIIQMVFLTSFTAEEVRLRL